MFNKKKIKKFTDCIFDLHVNQKVKLPKIMDILAENNCRYLRETAMEIKRELVSGNLFSNALFKCKYLHFDPTYILFICFAEKTGKLEDFIVFLKNRCERREKNIQKIISAATYPVFVLLLAGIFCVFLFIYGDSYFSNFEVEKDKFCSTLIKLVFFLIIFCCIIFFILKKNIGEDKLYESFMAVNFLVKSGIDIGSAVGYGIIVNGPDTKYGKIFEIAKQRLEYGMDLRSAFGITGKKGFISDWRNELDEALFFAQKAGEKSDVFEKICKWFEFENEKKREICLAVIEPLFTAITGIVLLVLMINFMMPVMNNVSLIL